MPMKKKVQYEVVRSIGRQDKIVRLKACPQERKKFTDLSASIDVRLVSKKINGKVC